MSWGETRGLLADDMWCRCGFVLHCVVGTACVQAGCWRRALLCPEGRGEAFPSWWPFFTVICLSGLLPTVPEGAEANGERRTPRVSSSYS